MHRVLKSPFLIALAIASISTEAGSVNLGRDLPRYDIPAHEVIIGCEMPSMSAARKKCERTVYSIMEVLEYNCVAVSWGADSNLPAASRKNSALIPRDVVVNYLRENMEKMSLPVVEVVAAALMEAFPCNIK